jgi:hypothetical protein
VLNYKKEDTRTFRNYANMIAGSMFCQRSVMTLAPGYSRANLIENINVNFTDVRSISGIAHRHYLRSECLFALGRRCDNSFNTHVQSISTSKPCSYKTALPNLS